MTEQEIARQIVCEEWHRAVKEFDLMPGSLAEAIVARIIIRLDETAALGESAKEGK